MPAVDHGPNRRHTPLTFMWRPRRDTAHLQAGTPAAAAPRCRRAHSDTQRAFGRPGHRSGYLPRCASNSWMRSMQGERSAACFMT